MLTVPNSASLAILTELKTSPNALNGVKMHLFKNPVSITVTTQLADFTEADFGGYGVSTAIVFGAPFVPASNIPTMIGDVKQFTADNTITTSNTIYGYYVTNSGGTVLLFAEPFDTPIIVALIGDSVVVVPAFSAVSQG